MMKKLFLIKTVSIALLLLTNFIPAQLVLTVTPTSESCTSNGSLSWTISGQTSGSVISYNIYKSPNFTTPIASTTLTNLTGLMAGTYRVTALETIGSVTTQTSKDAIITNTIKNLVYTNTIVHEVCGNDGKITVNVTQGTPVTYELLTGPVIKSPQVSNVFTGLPQGIYTVRVTDACGNAVSQSVTINKYTSNFKIDPPTIQPVFLDCSTIKVFHPISTINPNDVLYFPLQYKFIVHPPDGSSDIVLNYSYTYGSGGMQVHPAQVNAATGGFQFDIPYWEGQPYTYDLEITDSCGKVFTKNNTINITRRVELYSRDATCSQKYLNVEAYYFTSPVTMELTSYPSTYSGATTISVSSTSYSFKGDFGSATIPIPPGIYTVKVTDGCGNTMSKTITITNNIVAPSFYSYVGCGTGNASFYWYGPTAAKYVFAEITTAPAGFPYALPYNVTSKISTNQNYVVIEDMPAGSYTIRLVDDCGIARINTRTVTGYSPGSYTNTSISKLCGSFNVFMSNTGNNGSSVEFWLQKLNEITGQWGHPNTGVAYVSGQPATANSIRLTNNTLNGSYPYSGTFRIITAYRTAKAGLDSYDTKWCIEVNKEFNINYALALGNIYSYSCANGNYDVILEGADGVQPITYSITQKDGLPFVVNNGSSNTFTNLAPGTYNFRIEDNCGNILNKLVDIAEAGGLKIGYNNLCEGQNGSLFVSNVPGLVFSWWKDGNPSTILSTTSSLNFTPFTSATNAGIYHLDISSSTSTCISDHLTFTIPTNTSLPNAGADQSIYICKSINTINLDDHIPTGADTYGTWVETSASGQLNGSLWSPSASPAGTYTFNYVVNGLCSGQDTSTLTVNSANSNISLVKYSYKCSNDQLTYVLTVEVSGTAPYSISNATLTGTWSGNIWTSDAIPITQNFNLDVKDAYACNTINISGIPSCACYKNPLKTGSNLKTDMGITALGRAGADNGKWPMVRNGGWIAMEAKTKGFVINRLPFVSGLPVGIDASKFVEGMMVYDTTNNCLKIYNGTVWSCYTKQSCPD